MRETFKYVCKNVKIYYNCAGLGASNCLPLEGVPRRGEGGWGEKTPPPPFRHPLREGDKTVGGKLNFYYNRAPLAQTKSEKLKTKNTPPPPFRHPLREGDKTVGGKLKIYYNRKPLGSVIPPRSCLSARPLPLPKPREQGESLKYVCENVKFYYNRGAFSGVLPRR